MRLSFLAAALVAASLQPTLAQDAGTLDWTGGYVGAQAGVGSGSVTYVYNTAPPNIITFEANGFVAGVLGGYDWQYGNLVFGISGEITGTTISGSITGTQYPCSFMQTCTFSATWLGTAEVRAGVVIDRFMPFVTAGLAVGGISGAVDWSACFPASSTCAFDEMAIGKTFGAGVEVAIDEHISLSGKLQRMDLGAPEFPNNSVSSNDIVFNTMTFGANWRF